MHAIPGVLLMALPWNIGRAMAPPQRVLRKQTRKRRERAHTRQQNPLAISKGAVQSPTGAMHCHQFLLYGSELTLRQCPSRSQTPNRCNSLPVQTPNPQLLLFLFVYHLLLFQYLPPPLFTHDVIFNHAGQGREEETTLNLR